MRIRIDYIFSSFRMHTVRQPFKFVGEIRHKISFKPKFKLFSIDSFFNKYFATKFCSQMAPAPCYGNNTSRWFQTKNTCLQSGFYHFPPVFQT